MIATEKRRKAAQLLLDFYKGRITNDQMDDAWPRDAEDPALSRVFWAKWHLYSDLREEYIKPRLRKKYVTAKAVHCCLVFLKSGLEYEWIGFGRSKDPVSRILELFDSHRRVINRAGDQSVWPFYRKADYKYAWKHATLIPLCLM
ncbi:MAG TPA: hypothetical protein VMI10_02450 [Terriglobales bacterium]|nr:hypothetical protein [Terriglobales bacterium]